MPKLLTEIMAQTNGATLAPEERSYVRVVLGVAEDATNALYATTETRFDAMAANVFFNKAIRTLIEKYGKLGDDIIALVGVKNFASSDQRLRIAYIMQNLVFPPSKQAPLEDILTQLAERESAGQLIQNIPVRYSEFPDSCLDEYS